MKNHSGHTSLLTKIETFLGIDCSIFGSWMSENGEDIFCSAYASKLLTAQKWLNRFTMITHFQFYS